MTDSTSNFKAFKIGDLVTDPAMYRRKIYLVVGRSRAKGKIRICCWSHRSKNWSLPRTKPESDFELAPEDWPQTQSARKYQAKRGVLVMTRGSR